ncbi:unnamed protein product [Lathyrus oleraceus]
MQQVIIMSKTISKQGKVKSGSCTQARNETLCNTMLEGVHRQHETCFKTKSIQAAIQSQNQCKICYASKHDKAAMDLKGSIRQTPNMPAELVMVQSKISSIKHHQIAMQLVKTISQQNHIIGCNEAMETLCSSTQTLTMNIALPCISQVDLQPCLIIIINPYPALMAMKTYCNNITSM